ncbi:hypothetical protein [Bifidobacterium saguinibicoloris]|uniref:hypothetical protein n=1 Tax=Bifidobacterium saguinibicoloris TaxID=2834433 RepID=UPI001C55C07E|nr:hypothetical protein [Bifidobacterium saguinibicoloris]MBW3080060.1 hypothetical protein [Bifidobacterium saguinibicoloris]
MTDAATRQTVGCSSKSRGSRRSPARSTWTVCARTWAAQPSRSRPTNSADIDRTLDSITIEGARYQPTQEALTNH